MNIVLLSTTDLGHGAGIAAYRLHCAFRKQGVDSQMLVTRKLSNDPTVHLIPQAPINILEKAIRALQHALEFILNVAGPQCLYSVASNRLEVHPLIQKADIIHFHNIHDYRKNFSLLSFSLSEKKPVFWTLHDMWAITGHCFYSYHCERWKTGCGGCPDLKTFMRQIYDLTAWQWKIKKKIYSESRLNIITPSSWLLKLARQSKFFEHSNVVGIPYTLDQDVFFPQDKLQARKELDLPLEGKIILFVAPSLHPRKGFKYFEQALDRLKIKNFLVLLVGKNKVSENLKKNFNVKELGYVKDPGSIAKIYSAADVYVLPSQQDNLPNTILESFASGTPVIAFNSGGISDLVEHLKTGYLAHPGDVMDLAQGIDLLLTDDVLLKKVSQGALEKVTSQCSQDMITKKHLELYSKISKEYV